MPILETTRHNPTGPHSEHATPFPTVTVIIPAHDEQQFIKQCISSVFATGWPRERLEILVVDHNSTDLTATIARNAGAKVLVAAPNKRIGGVRNVGLAAATGDFVAFVDADCVVPRTWLTGAITLLRSDPRLGAVGGGPALAPSSGTWVERSLAPVFSYPGIVRDANTLVTYSFIARTKLLRELGDFNEELISGEDDDMSNRIRRSGRLLVATTDCRVVHYGFPRTLSAVVRKEMWHGSNHIDVRSGFDVTLALTLLFIAASLSAVLGLLASAASTSTHCVDALLTSLAAQFLPPALFALKKLKRSMWHWAFAPQMIAVGYAYFFGHSIGVLGNVYRRLTANRT